MKTLLQTLILVFLLLTFGMVKAADLQPGYEDATSLNQDTVTDQWQEMRDQPDLTDTSGVYNPVREFFKLNTKRIKPTTKLKEAKAKKGKKAEGQDAASKDPSMAAESKVDGKPSPDGKLNMEVKPKSGDSKAKSADGSTKSEF
jgi:hypothetical protein